MSPLTDDDAVRVLMVEDSADDARLILLMLQRQGLKVKAERVQTEEGLRAALESHWDVVLADFTVPGVYAPDTLRIVREVDPHMPVIVVSGTIGEDLAAELMRGGADDYVLKTNIGRLGPSINRSIRDARSRREHVRSLEALRESEERFRATFEHAATGLAHVAVDGRLLRVNRRFAETLGFTPHELNTLTYPQLFQPEDRQLEQRILATVFTRGAVPQPEERRLLRSDGTVAWAIRSLAAAGQSASYAVLALEETTTRKVTEEALRASEKRFRFLAENASDAIFLLSSEWRILEANPRSGEMLGYRPHHLIGKDLRQFFEAVSPADPRLDVAHEPGKSLLWERTLLRSDGTPVEVEISGRTLDTGGLLAIVRDISTRREAEEVARESDELFRLVSRASSDGIYDWRIDMDTLWVSERFRQTFGHPTDTDTVSLEWWEQRIHPDERQEVMKSLVDAIAGDAEKWSHEYRFQRGDGSWVWTLERGTFIRSDGVAVRMVGSMLDVTAHREKDQALHRSREKFRAFVEASHDILGLLDPDGTIRFVSPAVYSSTGWSPEELIGQNAFDLVHPNDREAARRIVGELVDAGTRSVRFETRVIRRDESLRWFDSLAVNGLENPAVGAILISMRDVTETRLMHAKMEEAQRLSSLGRLASKIGHEFNNVLMAIQQHAELVRRRSGDERIGNAVSMIERAVGRGKNITHQILRFSQPQPPALAPVHLASWLGGFQPELAAAAGEHHRVVLDIEGDPTAMVDTEQLGEALINLVANARDAMRNGGTIQVEVAPAKPDGRYPFGTVSSASGMVHLLVRDEGSGIPSAVLPHIYEPLFTTKPDGIGLGLSVTHQTIQRLRGQMFVESGEHGGTTFHIFLRKAVEETMAPVEPRNTSRAEKARSILIVEDEPAIAEGLSMMLGMEGMEVTSARTCAEALDAIDRGPRYDVLLIDLGLPDGNGIDLLRQIRRRGITTPALLSTGQGDERAIGNETGMESVDYLLKPYATADLLARIDHLLGP